MNKALQFEIKKAILLFTVQLCMFIISDQSDKFKVTWIEQQYMMEVVIVLNFQIHHFHSLFYPL